MQPFAKHTGLIAPLDRVNVDTDQMMPVRFCRLLTREGYGRLLFYSWRYLEGEKPNPDFVLNRPRYQGASILLARANFGCGSSREHAPWALEDYGFRVLIAPSFADIFYNNCFKNGILPIQLPQEEIDKLLDDASRGPNATLTVDLPAQEIRGPDGRAIQFDLDPFLKRCLIEGLDDIELTLEKAAHISEYEERSRTRRPWA